MATVNQTQLATILAYLQQAPTPVRAPGWEDQGYWGRPVVTSHINNIPSGLDWQILETVTTPEEYNTVLRHYIAAPLYLPYPAGLRFRLRLDDEVLGMNLAPGINRHHADGINQFQLVPQKLQVVMTDKDNFFIEVLNSSGQDQTVVSAVYGWHYYDPDGEIAASGESRVDAGTFREVDEVKNDMALRFFDE